MISASTVTRTQPGYIAAIPNDGTVAVTVARAQARTVQGPERARETLRLSSSRSIGAARPPVPDTTRL
eukprot:762790-Hanusia_phi.AAC.1